MSETTLESKEECLKIFLGRAYSQLQRIYSITQYKYGNYEFDIKQIASDIEEFELLNGIEIEELLK